MTGKNINSYAIYVSAKLRIIKQTISINYNRYDSYLLKTQTLTNVRQIYTYLSFNGEYAEDDDHKANMFNNYFSMQTVINDQNKQLPQLPLATDSVLESIKISVQDVRDVLNNLDVKKHVVQITLAPMVSGKVLLFSPNLFL